MDIYSNVSMLKGVGPKATEKLNRCGIFSVLDILLYFPRDYDFIENNVEFKAINGEQRLILLCEAKLFKRDVRTKNGKILTTIDFQYGGHRVIAKWFNQPYIKNNFEKGKKYNLMGKFKMVGNMIEVVGPIIVCSEAISNEILPKYPLKGDISNKLFEKLINTILTDINIKENLPQYILDKYQLISLDKAIRNIHFPENRNILERAKTRLKFQELFTYSLKLLILKHKLKKNNNGIIFNWSDELKRFKESLPFPLTNAQTKVVRDILRDQKSPFPMNRLIQGDVGSGKTIVALIAIFNVIKNNYQSVLMAPTEILAEQHYEEAKRVFFEI